MYDRKAIRRRRAVLAIFVALSIAILTAYFGESGGGVFHTLQRGAQEAFAPIETGASRALKPVRDFFGWAGDTIDAKDQNEALKKEVQQLRGDLAEAQTAVRDSGQLKEIAELHEQDYFPQATRPVTARVIAKSPTVWHSSVKIDKGTGDGVRVDQPVVAGGGPGREDHNAPPAALPRCASSPTARAACPPRCSPRGCRGSSVPRSATPTTCCSRTSRAAAG